MAQGMAMTLIPAEASEDGTIPFHKVGTHRRIDVEDVLAYRAKRNEQRRTALRELTKISEEIGDR
jgi:hypothetical protein